MKARRTTFLFVVAAALSGVYARLAIGGPAAFEVSAFDPVFTAIPAGAPLGPFAYEASDMESGFAFRVRARDCAEPTFLELRYVSSAPPEALLAVKYPAAEWSAVHVYEGKADDGFARIPAYLRHLASVTRDALTFSAHDPSDELYFSVYAPRSCGVAPDAAIAAVDAALQAIRKPGN